MPPVAEERIHKGKLRAAITRYESGRYSLRDGATHLGVSAPTFASILRRRGVRVRPAPHYGARTVRKPCTCRPTDGRRCSSCESMRQVQCSRCSRDARWVVELPDGASLPACRRHVLIIAEYKGGAAKLRSEGLSRRKKKGKKPSRKTKAAKRVVADAEDQAVWVRCRSWQRMFIALLSSGRRDAIEPAIKEYLQEASKLDERIVHKVTCPDCHTFTIEQPDDDGEADRFYLIAGVVYNALASYENPPDLCAILRRHCSQAPAGFSSIGW